MQNLDLKMTVVQSVDYLGVAPVLGERVKEDVEGEVNIIKKHMHV
jgi:hypothetical protein